MLHMAFSDKGPEDLFHAASENRLQLPMWQVLRSEKALESKKAARSPCRPKSETMLYSHSMVPVGFGVTS